MKKVVTMQDISCVGKCSLTVALPILSTIGIETAVIPTAVLSTHTMFQGFTFKDLTDQIEPIMNHWEKENFSFDAIYTGYLGSFEQLALAKQLFTRFGKGKTVIVDPCMADNGKLYPGFTPEFAKEMAKLCGSADIICPNLTEASFLLDVDYVGDQYDETYVKDMLKKLTDLGCKIAILTGISFEKGKLGVYAYDRTKDEYYEYYATELPVRFHGTGDIWASTFTGAYVSDKGIGRALQIACEYTKEAIACTLVEENHNTYGVNFEQAFPYLIKQIYL